MPERQRLGQQGAKVESAPEPINLPDAQEATLLASLNRRELLCPRCATPLEGTLVVAEAYRGIWLQCATCGFREW